MVSSEAESYERKHIAKGDLQTKRDVEMLGIGYTPVEIVNFMIDSLQEIMRDEFDTDLGSEEVEIFDPFTGTGRFLVGLMKSEHISDDDLRRKYREGEIRGQEILPESHRIAVKSVERAYEERMGVSEPYHHIRLGDTFQDGEAWYESKT